MGTPNNYWSKGNTEGDRAARIEMGFEKFVLPSTKHTWIIQQVPFLKAGEGAGVAPEVGIGVLGD